MWARLVAIVLGVWLMAAPAVLDYGDPAASNHHIVGPLVASFATIALWQATRGVARVNALLGLWLVVAPLVLDHPTDALVNGAVCGLLITATSFLGHETKQQFGGGWSALWSDQQAPEG